MSALDFKTVIGRIRVRIRSALAALSVFALFLLEQLGVINLTPILSMFLGEQKAAVLAGVISVVFAVMKPVFERAPPDDEDDDG